MRVSIVVILCITSPFYEVSAQGLWRGIKEKAKSAWNSDTRKDTWRKTKKLGSGVLASKSYTVPITERKFIDVIPGDYLVSISERQYRSFIKSSTLSQNNNRKARVKRVANRLIDAVEQFYQEQGMSEELEHFNWEFNLVNNKSVNAWCLPGGKIVVYDGIMSVADDDASLAIVLGHEIAHAIAKHSAEQMTKSIISAVGVSAIYMMISNSDMSSRKKMLAKLLASAGASVLSLKFSRIDETEADRIGLIIAAMAGYNPEKAIPFWKKMGKTSWNKSSHDWYSTHPSNTNRIDNIKSFIPEAREYYQTSH